MRSKLFLVLISTAIVSTAGCGSNGNNGQATNAARPDASSAVAVANSSPAPAASPANSGNASSEACKLLTAEDIQAVQNEAVKDSKGSTSGGKFAVSQCFYETATFTNSVSLSLTSKSAGANGESPRDFWKEKFGGEKEHKKEAGEEEEQGPPPKRVAGVGDEAYWVGNTKMGTLYVLKGDKFIRISVGGGDSQDKKMDKSKTLAQRALKRL